MMRNELEMSRRENRTLKKVALVVFQMKMNNLRKVNRDLANENSSLKKELALDLDSSKKLKSEI